MLVNLNSHLIFEWDLSHDVNGFWDRFLDGLAENREIIPNNRLGAIERYELSALFYGARDLGDVDWNRRGVCI